VDNASGSSSELTTAQLGKLRHIFEAALERAPEERAAFLDQSCAGDYALRAEVELLLAAHACETAWLDRPLLDSITPTSEPASTQIWEGRVAGSYRVLRQIGSGGMATVYLAERQIGKVSQKVALKMIRPSFTTNEQMMRRFEHEREILASLDHPNIARLLDIGSTEDRIPYLVMDFVEGERIDVYCENRELTVEERLRVFCTACQAIQYAHTKGVVHRDLKPSNILITADGSVKLLDFGIAKVLSRDAGVGTLVTQSGAALMTIEYASPEQIRGDSVGPQSDVYSLGVLLYELLTGRRPYRTEGQLMHVIARAICEEEPITPSSVVIDPAAEHGYTDPDAKTQEHSPALLSTRHIVLSRRLAGDLDSILLKSLRKEPEWRYSSPEEFSEDIRRHLAGDRVLARDDTFRYRMERIVRRLLHPANGVFHTQGMVLLTAGLLGVIFLLERHEILSGRKASANAVLDISLVAVWMLWAFWQGRSMARTGRFSALDRQSWIVFTVLTAMLGTLSLASEFRFVLSPESMGIFWNAGLAMGLTIVGVQASRILTAGGVTLFASAVIANFYPGKVYLLLAAGIVFGMIVPGLILTLQPNRIVPIRSSG
jgi:serine/threonine protein kinase